MVFELSPKPMSEPLQCCDRVQFEMGALAVLFDPLRATRHGTDDTLAIGKTLT